LNLLLVMAALASRPVVAFAQEQSSASAPTDLQLGPSPDLTPFLGLPVQSVQVQQQGRWRSRALVRSVRRGEPMNAAVGRRAARELLASGEFADVQVRVVRVGDGAQLQLLAVPRRLLAARRLNGSPLDAGEVWRTASIDDGAELTERMLHQLADRVTSLHVRRGFPQAATRVETRDTDDPMRVVLLVDVAAGPAQQVANRVLLLAPGRRAALEEIVHGYEVDRGDPADEAALDAADQRLQETLRSRNYPEASVTHQTVVQRGSAFVFVRVEPGALLRFRFEGNERFDRDRLTEVIDYDKDPDRAPSALADRIRSFYQSMGFLDAHVRVQERGDRAAAIRDVVFHIREGDRVRVGARSFPCLRGGPRTAAEVASELDGFLAEELPGPGLLGSVNPGVVDDTIGPQGARGARPAPLEPEPLRTYAPQAYDKSIKQLQDLYRSEGYLSAAVGPVQVVRRKCHRYAPAGGCLPVPLPVGATDACRLDPWGLPVDDPDSDPRLMCTPDVASGTHCEPQVQLRIPVKLGPRATLYDIGFEGNRTASDMSLFEASELALGQPASNLELEQARRRILEAYRERGFAYAEVRASLELSPDHTRARARFVINESQQVIVDRFEIVGAERTSKSLILGRIALERGEPYRQSAIRKTEERIATLGVFSSVSVALQDPYVPAQRKAVIIQVQERVPQYLDIRPGFSTGEGVRVQFEYGHLNIAGEAIQFTLRVRLSYLPDPFILDADVRRNLSALPLSQRLERHNTASVIFPEVGLGPLISLGLDGVDVRSNARDYGLSKNAVSATLNYRPVRTLTTSLGGSLERNDVAIFGGQTVEQYLQRPGVTSDLQHLLLAPDGLTVAVAQRVTASWDRRDSALAATRGTLLGGAVEHVRAFPGEDNPNTTLSDFLRVSGVVSGYVRLSKRGMVLAGSLRAGRIFQLLDGSETYPDRLFFLGGVDSMRGFLRDSVVPQDVAERIMAADPNDPDRLTVRQVAIRGGDVFVNPRAELRIPLSELVQTTLFLDSGNLWVEPDSFEPWKLRYAGGSGVRVATPIGPIAFDYGVNLIRRSWEDFGAFHFSIGLF
jgi:outer membrane protein assembly factor BamA